MDFSSFMNSGSGQGIMGLIGNIAGSSGGAGGTGGSGAGNVATKIYKKVRGVGQTMAGSTPNVGQGSDVEKPQYSTLDVTDTGNQMSGSNYLSDKTIRSGKGTQADTSGTSGPTSVRSVNLGANIGTSNKLSEALDKFADATKIETNVDTSAQAGATKKLSALDYANQLNELGKKWQSSGYTNNEILYADDPKNNPDNNPNNKTTADLNSLHIVGGDKNTGATYSGRSQEMYDNLKKVKPVSQSEIMSDERLKDIFKKEDGLDCFSRINAYLFKYKPEAQELYKNKDVGVDNKPHVGVMAQELANNPITSSSVVKDSNGFLEVDPKSLTMTNTAMLAELTRRVEALEKMLKEKINA